MSDKRRVLVPKDAKIEPRRELDLTKWWNQPLDHPLSDEQFVDALLNHVMTTSEDGDIRIVRKRVHTMIRNVLMKPGEIAKQLDAYRQEHPHEAE